jgi:hypothetical protein
LGCDILQALLQIEEPLVVSYEGEDGIVTLELSDQLYQFRCMYVSKSRGVRQFAVGDSFVESYLNLVDRFVEKNPEIENSHLSIDEIIEFGLKLMKDDTVVSFELANSTYTWNVSPYLNGTNTFDKSYDTPESSQILLDAVKYLASFGFAGYFNDRDTRFTNLFSSTEKIIQFKYNDKNELILEVNASSIIDARQKIMIFLKECATDQHFMTYSNAFYDKVKKSALENEPFFYSSYEQYLLINRLIYMFTSNPTPSNSITTNWISMFSFTPTLFQMGTIKIPTIDCTVPKEIHTQVKPVGFYSTTNVQQIHTTKMWHAKCTNCYTYFDVPFYILEDPKTHNKERICPHCNKYGINYKKCNTCNKYHFCSSNPIYSKCPSCKK